MGDFNVNLMNYQSSNLTGEFLDGMYSNLLCPLINRPTRITSHTATFIDILTNNIDADLVNGLIFSDISDHLPIFSLWFDDYSNVLRDNSVHMFRDKSEKNVRKFDELITNYDWSRNTCSLSDPREAYTKFSNDYKQFFDECFPLKRRSGKNRNRKPWLTNGLLRSIKTKNKLYMQFIGKADPAKEQRYKNYKNNLSRLIRVAKRLYYDKKFEENKTNTKQTWKYLNDIINKKKNKLNRINTFLSQDNREISDPLEIANRFCHFFSNISSNLAKKIPSTPSWSPESYLANQNNLNSFSLQIRLLMMKL